MCLWRELGGLPCCSRGVSPYKWSGSVGCHCTIPSDAVVGYRNGKVEYDVGCFFCYLMYFHALLLVSILRAWSCSESRWVLHVERVPGGLYVLLGAAEDKWGRLKSSG